MSDTRFNISNKQIKVRGWPGCLGEIANLLGDEIAEKIASEFSDKKLYIPTTKRLKEDGKLAKLIGFDNAKRLCDHLGGIEYTVPSGRWALTRHKVRVMRAANWENYAIAKALKYRRDTVERHIDDMHAPDGPPEKITMKCYACGTHIEYDPVKYHVENSD